jgi:type I restriction enzyme S subunit
MEHRKEFITIDDLTTYRRPRVQLHAQGIVLRDAVLGAEIKTKKQQIARAGEFLVAEIDAKVGGFGIVPDSLDGTIVSSHYFLYRHRPERLDNKYLGCFVKTRAFRQQIEAQGSTNYAAIRPDDVLGYQIPLPPIDEQRRIVARIEELAAKVDEARKLRIQTTEESPLLVDSFLRERFDNLTKEWGTTTLDQVLADAAYGTSEKSYPTREKDAVPVLRIPNVASEKIRLSDLKYSIISTNEQDSLTLKDGDVLIVRTNGSLDLVGRSAVVRGLQEPTVFASYLIRLRFDHSRLIPEYAQIGLRHLRRSGALVDFARTTAGQYNVSLGRLRGAAFPIPPLSFQQTIVAELNALQSRVDAVKTLQSETARELDAMIPAILDKAFKGELV